MNIFSSDDLVQYMQDYNNQEDDNGMKKTGFDDDMLIVLDIITIFRKMQKVQALADKGKINIAY